MKFALSYLTAATLSVQGVTAAISFASSESTSKYQTRGWIVELEKDTSSVKRDGDDNAHSQFHRRASSLLSDYSVKREFTNSNYFHGAAVDAGDADSAAVLAAIPGVKNVWPNRMIPRPSPIGYEDHQPIDTDVFSSPSAFRAGSSVNVTHMTGDSDVQAYLALGNVDKVHAMDITGEGMTIAIIDTGVDYRHPSLGGGFGPGFKISGGYDLVGDDYTGANEPVPDEDPLVTCLSGAHGTHVSGIVGARDAENVGYGILGVAPDAEINMYKVFGCVDSTQDDVLLEAFGMVGQDAVADVVSMSIGQDTFWESGGVYDSTFAALAKQGIPVYISAGNSGGGGPYYASEPALSPGAVAVGAVANTKFPVIFHANDTNGNVLEYASLKPLANDEFHVVGVSGTDAICTEEAWNDAIKNFPNKDRIIMAVSLDATCYQYQLKQLAAAVGVDKLITTAYEGTNLAAEAPGYGQEEYVTYQVLPSTMDTILKGLADQGEDYLLSFPDREIHDSPQVVAGKMDVYSSYGPTMEMSLKPQLSAPGGNILSTWPVTSGGGYAVESGTSMAAPYAAAVYALVKQSNPDLTPEEILHRLQATSIPLEHPTEDLLSTTAKQGAGLVDVLAAISSSTTITPSEINLRDSAEPVTRNITIENKSSKAKTYTLSHQGASTMYTWPTIYNQSSSTRFRFEDNNMAKYAKADFSSSTTIEVPASGKTTFEVTLTPPTDGVDVHMLPIYGGYINIESSDDDDDSLSIPYLGVPYTRSEVSILSVPDDVPYYTQEPQPPQGVPRFPLVYSLDESERNSGKATYTFPADPDNNSSFSDNDPVITLLMMQPTSYVRLDVVDVDFDYEGEGVDYLGFDPDVKHNVTKPNPEEIDLSTLDEFLGVQSYGSIITIVGGFDKPSNPNQIQSRGIDWIGGSWPWATVGLGNGTKIQLPNADYRVLIRALKSGYDVEDRDGYESWLGPIIGVNITSDQPNPELNTTTAVASFSTRSAKLF